MKEGFMRDKLDTIAEVFGEVGVNVERLVEECERITDECREWPDVAKRWGEVKELEGKEEWVRILAALTWGLYMGWKFGLYQAVIDSLIQEPNTGNVIVQ